MATVRALIKGSLRLIGAIATGETPSADEEADALSVLNDMVDSWSTESLLVYAIVREQFTLTSSKQVYTMGSGGDFNTTRPQKIVSALIQIQTNPTNELPIHIMNQEEFSHIAVKDIQSSFPVYLYAEGSYPLETINLWPVPLDADKLVLYSWKPLSEFASVNTSMSLPPGYVRALRYNLALEIAPEYGKQPDLAIVNSAMEAKENIKRMNIKPHYLSVDAGALAQHKIFNWLTGE